MNKGLADQFSHLIPPTVADQERAISEGMIAVDTDVLLTLYLYSSNAREHLMSALANVSGRLWLSHQAALEFHRHRLLIIDDRGRSYNDAMTALKAYDAATQRATDQIRAFANRIGMATEDKDRLVGFLTPDIDSANQMIRDLESEREDFDPTTGDPILRRLESIFSGRVGEPYDADSHEQAINEAKRRIDNRIPPGYSAAAKDDATGDYLQWDQTLNEAATQKPRYLLLVTGSLKVDWVLRVRGRTLGPRPELALEAQQRADCKLVIINISQFLVLVSNYSHTQVSNATLEEGARIAESVQELRKRLG
ncbi:PIN-like domain-containing protein [Amycolatopsis sp. DG1A-15b]|uniref:PIN-like domain-containing protein n=1 Tax=Amycolatopsis sp. DG1A-15b TaxID=3052846 RepID=UPI00255B986D|nr:PIN-like domain-containing protein [Amycolatopsis sp. DG1A-15b]WIX92541.1 PIN-like domain-containing protein [Amycolatopsis sp. DG1A-15b]